MLETAERVGSSADFQNGPARKTAGNLTQVVMRQGLRSAAAIEKVKRVAKSLAELPNIGPAIANRLNEIGVCTQADLRRLGPVNSYLRICAKYPHQTIPVCYYLYSLQGALMGLHWDDLPERLKKDLLSRATERKRRGGPRTLT